MRLQCFAAVRAAFDRVCALLVKDKLPLHTQIFSNLNKALHLIHRCIHFYLSEVSVGCFHIYICSQDLVRKISHIQNLFCCAERELLLPASQICGLSN